MPKRSIAAAAPSFGGVGHVIAVDHRQILSVAHEASLGTLGGFSLYRNLAVLDGGLAPTGNSGVSLDFDEQPIRVTARR